MEDLLSESTGGGNSFCYSDSSTLSSSLEFWVGGVARLVVCPAGIAANVVVILVFSRPDMSNVFNRHLMLLAYFDASYLLFCLADALIITTHGVAAGTNVAENVFWWLVHPFLLHPMQQIFLTASIYMTVAVSVDRYLAVLHPLSVGAHRHHRSRILTALGNHHARRRFCRAHAVAAAVLLFSLAYALPHFFEFSCCEYDSDGSLVAVPTDFRKGTFFSVVYAGYVDAVIRTLVPAFVMLHTASRIMPVVRETYRETYVVVQLYGSRR